MTEHSPPFFSVVIPTFQRNDLLAKCLACLAPSRQLGMLLVDGNTESGPETRDHCVASRVSSSNVSTNEATTQHLDSTAVALPFYEVIVADDGRTTTAEVMIRYRFPWVRWVKGPGIGPAANRNAGAAVAKGAWLAFTDDDCLPQPEWLRGFWTAIAAHPGLTVFEGKTVPDRPRLTLAEHSPIGSQAGNLWSCNFAILRSQFEQLGGFDSQFRVCMEDNDFALRVRQGGLIFPFVEDALVVHPWRSRHLAGDGWKTNQAELMDHLRFKRKHPNVVSMEPARMVRLGLRVFWSDLCFVWQRFDLVGLPFAFIHLIRVLHIAFLLSRQP
jgi:GT2 family glycosyltransferase